MPSRNHAIQNIHFHKDWQERVRTWFNQPARKVRRRTARAAKAIRVFPRPVQGPLRPVVHAPTKRYNMKVRYGRGFTLEEIREAGINKHQALSIGISVDYRRRNKTDKSLKANVQRLKQYKSKLVLFPRDWKTPKQGEASKEEFKKAEQQRGQLLPIRARHTSLEVVKASDIPQDSAYLSLRRARSDARLVGVRAKKKAEKDAAAASVSTKE